MLLLLFTFIKASKNGVMKRNCLDLKGLKYTLT